MALDLKRPEHVTLDTGDPSLDPERPNQITTDTMVTQDAYVNDNGHLVVSAFISRPGVFEYLAREIKPQWPGNSAVQAYGDSDILRAYRSNDEVTGKPYLDSAKYVPVTDGHPPVMLHPNTVGSYPVGTSTHKASVSDGRPKVELVLWDERAIEAKKNGKREISVGAYNRFVWGPGLTEDGQPYDFKIEGSRVNHIAIVERGRAGRSVRIMDAAPPVPVTGKGKTMKITIGGATFDIDDNAAALLTKERESTRKTIDRLEGENEALKARKTSVDDDELNRLVDEGIKARESASRMADVRATVTDAGFDVTDKSDDHVLGLAEGLGDLKPAGMKIKSTTDEKPFDRQAAKRSMYGAC